MAFANGNSRMIVIQLVQSSSTLYFKINDGIVNSSLQVVDIEDLACPVNQCCIFLNKLSGPLSIETRLVSQIATMVLTDQDLANFIKLE